MLAKSCEGYTSNPRNQLDSKKVLPLAGKFTPTAAAAAQSQPRTSLPYLPQTPWATSTCWRWCWCWWLMLLALR